LLINSSFLHINVNLFNIYENHLVIVLNKKLKNDANDLANFLLKNNLEIDKSVNNIYEFSLEYTMEYNICKFVNFPLIKKFGNNY